MPTTIRAAVRRFPRVGAAPFDEPWFAVVYTVPAQPGAYESAFTKTLADAIDQLATLRAKLDARLMDEVHESRAARRTA